jgi:hypothetical protein
MQLQQPLGWQNAFHTTKRNMLQTTTEDSLCPFSPTIKIQQKYGMVRRRGKKVWKNLWVTNEDSQQQHETTK